RFCPGGQAPFSHRHFANLLANQTASCTISSGGSRRGVSSSHHHPDALELGHVLVIRHGDPPVVLLQGPADPVRVVFWSHMVLRVGAGVGYTLARYLASRSLQSARRREPRACPCAYNTSDSQAPSLIRHILQRLQPRRHLARPQAIRGPVHGLAKPPKFLNRLFTSHRQPPPCIAAPTLRLVRESQLQGRSPATAGPLVPGRAGRPRYGCRRCTSGE